MTLEEQSLYEYIRDKSLIYSKPLYKGLKREHALSLINDGIFRIGTLYEYQDEEKYGVAIGNRDEGIKEHFTSGDEFFDTGIGPLPDFVNRFFNLSPHSNARISNNILRETIECANHYVYCLSANFSNSCKELFSYDTVVEIFNPSMFFKRLTLTLFSVAQIKLYEVPYPCVYLSKRVHFTKENEFLPLQLKDPKYAYQNEVRVVWTLENDEEIFPKFVKSPGAARYCRIIELANK